MEEEEEEREGDTLRSLVEQDGDEADEFEGLFGRRRDLERRVVTKVPQSTSPLPVSR